MQAARGLAAMKMGLGMAKIEFEDGAIEVVAAMSQRVAKSNHRWLRSRRAADIDDQLVLALL